MTMLILDAEQVLDLQEMNKTGSPTRQVQPIQLPDGRHALNADLLMDLDPGETWWHYRTVLLDLPAESVMAFTEAAV